MSISRAPARAQVRGGARVLVVALLGGLLLLVAPAAAEGNAAVGTPATVEAGAGSGAVPAPSAAVPSAALAVLHRWDAARAAAYRQRDPGALRALYLPGAQAARRDLAVLRRYAAQGVTVTMMRTQVLGARTRGADAFDADVAVRHGHRLRLVVLDRVVAAGADGAHCLRLPVRRPHRRVIELARTPQGWLVATVRRA